MFILEDDAQDGADHVDSHRSPAYTAARPMANAFRNSANLAPYHHEPPRVPLNDPNPK